MTTKEKPLVGIGMMILAMLIIPISDGFVKLLSERYPILFLNWARFFVGGVIFFPLALRSLKQSRFTKNQLLALSGRTLLHVLAISLYFLAIARLPLADALGAYFIAPVVAVVLSALLLGESLTRYQIFAVMLGFIGALIVVRPGGSTDVGMFFAIGSGIVFGLFLVLTRRAANTAPALTILGFQCALGAVILLPIAVFYWTPIQWVDGILIGISGVIWVAGHLAIIYAFTHASAGTLAPIVYFEILGGAVVGYLLFGHIPSVNTVVGIAIIIWAGLLAQRSATKNLSEI